MKTMVNRGFNTETVESKDEIGVLGATFNQMTADIQGLITSLERLNQVGISLSREHDLNKLLSTIVKEARELTNADAGNLYVIRNNKLSFEISQYATLDEIYPVVYEELKEEVKEDLIKSCEKKIKGEIKIYLTPSDETLLSVVKEELKELEKKGINLEDKSVVLSHLSEKLDQVNGNTLYKLYAQALREKK